MTQQTNIKGQIWTALFLVTPVVMFSTFSDNFTNSSTNKIIFAGVFGGLGGLLGWGLYFIVKSKTTIIKIVSLTALLGLGISTILFISNLTKPELTTCEICGYMTLKSTSTECDYCGNTTWDENKSKAEFATKQDWIKSGQIFWFSIDSLSEKIDFYNPTIDEGFVKDKNWRPIVSEQEIRDELNNDK
jgi:transcription elongation factor Elf1/phage shock protein PspC (stress-responsive transcriptional regulator)